MALLYASALELYDEGAATALLASEDAVLSADTPGSLTVEADGMHSQRALRYTATNYVRVAATMNAATGTMIVQCAVKVETIAAHPLLLIDGSMLPALTVALTAAGALTVSGAALAGTSPVGTIRAGRWHYLEIKMQHRGSGRVKLRVDGTTVVDATGVDTSGDSGDVVGVALRGAAAGVSWSDILVMDGSGSRCNDLLGPNARIALLSPIADGASVQWTANGAAADWQALADDIPGAHDGADSYIETSTVGHLTTAQVEKLAPSAVDVHAVSALIEGEATAIAVKPAIVVGSTQSAGSNADFDAVGAGYKLARHTLHHNPATGARWTRDTVATARVAALAATP